MIKDVDPMLDSITVQGRCISFWHLHRLNEAHNPYSLDMLLQDSQANMWDEYAQKRNELGHVVFILQLGKVKYWDGRYYAGIPSIHNALFGTKMFTNRDLLEIQVFRQRFKELPKYDENQSKISVFPLKSQLSQSRNFSMGRSRRWSRRFVNVNRNPTASSTQRFIEYTKKMAGPILHVKSVTKRLKLLKVNLLPLRAKTKLSSTMKTMVIMRIIDQSGSAPIFFFNTMINKLLSYTAWELMERHAMDVDEYWPRELLDLVGKRFLFKIYFSDYNVNNNNHTYRCDAVNDDPEFIKHFKDGFMQDEDSEDEFTTPANKIKVNNFTDDSLNRVLEMPPPSIEMGASGSGSVSGSKVNNFTDNSLNRVLKMRTPSTEMGVMFVKLVS
nr:hypothetical protein [Tanacetum cinerariifolium]